MATHYHEGIFHSNTRRRKRRDFSIELYLATRMMSAGNSGGIEEEEESKQILSSLKRLTPSKPSFRQGMITEHNVNVGRRHFTPTGENPDEEGTNLELDAEITPLNEKKRPAENRVVDLERVRGYVCVKSFITVMQWKV
ncbi:unnamed protein product [Linum trigynum]|uniref:Uncharacterized protein n=1 Tax=Linum trigynum TaxID=586398 RepID=A0AAV2DZS0_9ROSI